MSSKHGLLLKGQIHYARNEDLAAWAVTVAIPEAWLELPREEFAWRIEDSFDRMRDTFNEIYLRKHGG